jgi:hypothetical protein
LCNYVLDKNLENPFQLFILLKLVYPEGKLKFSDNEINFLALVLNVHTKTIKANAEKLIQLNWMRLNTKTNYYLIHSFDRIRLNYGWESRASIEMYNHDVFRIQAILGAATYGYLHKDFWRKVKKEKVVQLKECTYHFLLPSFNYKLQPAPISVNGVKAIFNIPQAKASRIKKLANAQKLIQVQKTYKKLCISKFDLEGLKQYTSIITNNIIFKEGNYYLQQIDHIIPLFPIRKRKKLET